MIHPFYYSLETQTHKGFNVIITDDGTTNPLVPNEHPIIDKYIWSKDDGYHRVAALNNAIDLAVSSNIIILDDDCIPQSDRFVEQHLLNLSNYLISRGVIYFPSDGGNADAWFSTANLGIKTSIMREVGKFDMNLDGHYGHDDQILSIELKKHGYKESAPYHNDTMVHHIGANYANNDRSWAIIGHNTQYCIDKYGIDPRKPMPW